MPSLRDVLASPELQGIYSLQIIRQSLPNACACACVATVLRHLGMYASERMLVDALEPSAAVGLEPKQIIEFFSGKGLMASGYKGLPALNIIDRAKAGKFTLLLRRDRVDHWIIPVGIEPLMSAIVFADPSRPEGSFTCADISAFISTWEPELDLAIAVDRPCAYSGTKRQLTRKVFAVRRWVSADQREKRYGEQRRATIRDKRAQKGL